MTRSCIALGGALALAAGCAVGGNSERDPGSDTAGDPGGGAPITTDADSYTLAPPSGPATLSIVATYTNDTDQVVFIEPCGGGAPFSLQKQVDGQWQLAYSPICPMILVPPLEIAAGESYTDTLEIREPREANVAPSFSVAPIAGTYRLVYSIYGTWTGDTPGAGLGEQLSEERRVSNEFEVRE